MSSQNYALTQSTFHFSLPKIHSEYARAPLTVQASSGLHIQVHESFIRVFLESRPQTLHVPRSFPVERMQLEVLSQQGSSKTVFVDAKSFQAQQIRTFSDLTRFYHFLQFPDGELKDIPATIQGWIEDLHPPQKNLLDTFLRQNPLQTNLMPKQEPQRAPLINWRKHLRAQTQKAWHQEEISYVAARIFHGSYPEGQVLNKTQYMTFYQIKTPQGKMLAFHPKHLQPFATGGYKKVKFAYAIRPQENNSYQIQALALGFLKDPKDLPPGLHPKTLEKLKEAKGIVPILSSASFSSYKRRDFDSISPEKGESLQVRLKQKHLVAMPYLEGGDLFDWIVKRQLDSKDKLQVCVQLIKAVRSLHTQHLVHRDIKPDNIFIREGETLLGDLDHLLRVDDPEDILGAFGTASYMPLESFSSFENVFLGHSPVKPDSPHMIPEERKSLYAIDLWQLGVTLYATCTGSMVTAHEFPKKKKPSDYQDYIKNRFFDENQQNDLKAIHPEMPGILWRLLQFWPEHRKLPAEKELNSLFD